MLIVRGATIALAATLLLVIAIVAGAAFFGYFNALQADITAAGQEKMVVLEIPPKLLSLVCYSGYGYVYLSLSQGQDEINGTLRLTVHKDTGALEKEMFLNISIDGPEKVYLPVAFSKNDRYIVKLSGRKWEISEYCTPVNDPKMELYLPFDDATGSVVSDESDYDNDCSVILGPWTTGYFLGGLHFNGTTRVDCGGFERYNLTELTVSVLINISSLGAEQAIWGGYNSTDDLVKNYFFIGSDDRARFDQSPPDGGNNINTSVVSTDEWWHLVVTKDSYYVNTYVNGALNSTNSTVEEYSGGYVERWFLGYKYFGTPTAYLNAVVDEFRLYSRVLSADEIEALYGSYLDQ